MVFNFLIVNRTIWYIQAYNKYYLYYLGAITSIALPIASIGGLVIGAVNSINAMNQQSTLDDNKNKIQSLTNDISDLKTRTTSLESRTSTVEAGNSGISTLTGK